MRNTLKIIGIAMAFVMAIGVFSSQARTKKKYRTIKKEKKVNKMPSCALEMVESGFQGMRLERVATVRVERVDGKVVLTAKGSVSEEEKFTIPDGEELLKEAEKIILEEKMLEYGVSYSLDPSIEILDGSSWHFDARFTDGRSVSSHGHNAEPNGNGLPRMRTLLLNKAIELMNVKYGNE